MASGWRRISWGALAAGMLVGWLLLVSVLGVVVVTLSAQVGCSGSTPVSSPISPRGRSEIPAWLLPIYARAAAAYRLGPQGWAWLASINRQETDFGRNLSTSSAGALGWMQFLPQTWAVYGVDVHHTGHPDPNDPADAIFAAARYLRASGAPAHWQRAVFAYNPAQWYVRQVASRAHAYLGTGGARAPVGGAPGSLPATLGPSAANPPGAVIEGPGGVSVAPGAGCVAAAVAGPSLSAQGYALPLDRRYMHRLGRTDDGVDIETAPDGATVYSITPGRCSAVAANARGFGPNYPVIEATSGSLAGQYIYYGHVARALVSPGQAVRAGQPIAVMGHTGDAAALGHGHIEIGFSTASGDPLSHHGARAWTPNGERMRRFLIRLGASLGIRLA
jgi:murein DD-endopeptidase MepM/ murein hydrolase activator NlpD